MLIVTCESFVVIGCYFL